LRNEGDEVSKAVERLFSFVLRAGIIIVGREVLARSKSKLQFLLITDDISENSRKQLLADFAHYPIVQHYSSEEIERFFNLKSTKVIGFAKSGLTKSVYAELKQYRINKPASGSGSKPAEAVKQSAQPAEPEKKPELSPEEQMANYEDQLKEDDWGHQPC